MQYSIVQLSQPDPLDLVSVEDLGLHLGLNTSDDDDLLAIYIKAAYAQFEADTDGAIILPTQFRQYLPCWSDTIRLERGNVQSVSRLAYYSSDDTDTDAAFTSDVTGCPAWVFSEETPTSLSTVRRRPVFVEFTSGFAQDEETGQTIPESVRLYVLLLAAHFYSVREAFSTDNLNEVPAGIGRIANQFRTPLGGSW